MTGCLIMYGLYFRLLKMNGSPFSSSLWFDDFVVFFLFHTSSWPHRDCYFQVCQACLDTHPAPGAQYTYLRSPGYFPRYAATPARVLELVSPCLAFVDRQSGAVVICWTAYNQVIYLLLQRHQLTCSWQIEAWKRGHLMLAILLTWKCPASIILRRSLMFSRIIGNVVWKSRAEMNDVLYVHICLVFRQQDRIVVVDVWTFWCARQVIKPFSRLGFVYS